MISRYEVTLNGLPLSAINASILITDISYSAAKFSDESYNVAKRHGSRIWSRSFKSAAVKIKFAIRAYSISERQTICAAVVKWAKDGGELQCNDRPNQRLRCVCTEFPYIDSALNWTDELSMTFTAYTIPFWEDVIPTVLTLDSTSGGNTGATIYIPGNVGEALVEAKITLNAAYSTSDNAITLATLKSSDDADYTSISIDGINMASGKTIELKYDDQMIQSIYYIASSSSRTSLIPYRTGSTDLLVPCGEKFRLRFRPRVAATCVYTVRGLWL